MNKINVLSLFDGCSCGRQALDRIEIDVDKYFASEIDKSAIKVTMANYPNTIQIGNVLDLDVSKLPFIHLLLGGSPCTDFSMAGKRKGASTKDEQDVLTLEHYLELKSQGYEFEGQSYLFWEYMRVLTDVRKINPEVKFLLENVMMESKWEKVLSKAIGVNPLMIDSKLLSAQQRERLYWTNIGMKPAGLFGDSESMIQQPKDKKILLKDILEKDVDEKYFLTNWINDPSKNGHKKRKIIQYVIPEIVSVRKYDVDIKGLQKCLRKYKKTGNLGVSLSNQFIADKLEVPKTMVEHWFRTDKCFSIPDKDIWLKLKELLGIETDEFDLSITEFEEKESVFEKTNRVYDEDGLAPTLTSTGTDERVLVRRSILVPEATEKGFIEVKPGESFDFKNPNSKTRRGRKMEDKSNCLVGKQEFLHYTSDYRIRKFTPTECERLQTMRDGYTDQGVSDNQRLRMIGNGWTISVIEWIFSYLPKEYFV
jgi:site-specific DNA-cytosine methylase